MRVVLAFIVVLGALGALTIVAWVVSACADWMSRRKAR